MPGSGARCSDAPFAVAVSRGSTTMWVAPAARPCVEALHGRRHRRRGVGAHQQHRLGLADVGEREGQSAVDAEGPVARGRRRGHAEPAVVVDHRGAQRDPGELAEGVGLLVGQAAAAEAADGVAAVLGLHALQALGHQVERLVPGRGAERARAVAGDGAHQRGQQPLRVVEQAGGRPALGAQPAAVGREVRLRLQGRRPVPGHHRDPALQGAVRAVGEGGNGGHATIVGDRCYSRWCRSYGRFTVLSHGPRPVVRPGWRAGTSASSRRTDPPHTWSGGSCGRWCPVVTSEKRRGNRGCLVCCTVPGRPGPSIPVRPLPPGEQVAACRSTST